MSEILPPPFARSFVTDSVDHAVQRLRAAEEQFPYLPRFDESALPPRNFTPTRIVPGGENTGTVEEARWIEASLAIIRQAMRRQVELVQEHQAALDAGVALGAKRADA